ncbi:aminotransferase class I/II-fold pyridoxal phosphate-dependent enzyme [Streptomyces goshikiensis]|uniref:aminotransferase class I/II-fold pyridoxal phosphate-dependent enzyme n=1 Tax=Streptomyces goshikiensis TaxID=1942 RepID=UPI0036549788
MPLSLIGSKMATLSGLRNIMEDIAVSTASGPEDWMNLGIGNPALIPPAIAEWQSLTEQALAGDFASVSCLYGPSRGAPVLVRAITDYFNDRYGWGISPANVVVGPGSQMLCFIAAALFSGPGEPQGSGLRKVVLPLAPDYTGYQGLSMHPGGITGVPARPVAQEGRFFRYSFDFPALEGLDDIGMMLLSSPGNPTGRTIDTAELEFLTDLAARRDVPLLLDHAYGEPFPQIGATQVAPPWHEHVINCFTLSKAGLPGERVAFAIGPERYIGPMVSFLANSALHAPQLAQTVVARSLSTGRLDALVSEVISPFYRERRLTAEKMFLELMPDGLDWRMHSGDGGMFCWFWINDSRFDDMELYERLKRKKVFIVPGRHFFVDDPAAARGPGAHRTRCFRVSLSPDPSVLARGGALIAETLREMCGGN